jgi:hypothetical protein
MSEASFAAFAQRRKAAARERRGRWTNRSLGQAHDGGVIASVVELTDQRSHPPLAIVYGLGLLERWPVRRTDVPALGGAVMATRPRSG